MRAVLGRRAVHRPAVESILITDTILAFAVTVRCNRALNRLANLIVEFDATGRKEIVINSRGPPP